MNILCIMGLPLAIFLLLIFTHVSIHMKLNNLIEKIDSLSSVMERALNEEIEQAYEVPNKKVE
jgi:hypothetical protein